MEIVGPSKRVWTGVMVQVFFAIGMTILSGVAYFIRDWHTLELAMAVPVGIFLIYWWSVLNIMAIIKDSKNVCQEELVIDVNH